MQNNLKSNMRMGSLQTILEYQLLLIFKWFFSKFIQRYTDNKNLKRTETCEIEVDLMFHIKYIWNIKLTLIFLLRSNYRSDSYSLF